jgi:hypothetical protein
MGLAVGHGSIPWEFTGRLAPLRYENNGSDRKEGRLAAATRGLLECWLLPISFPSRFEP